MNAINPAQKRVPLKRVVLACTLAMGVVGCTTFDIDQSIEQATRHAQSHLPLSVQLSRDGVMPKASSQTISELLKAPLSQESAVKLAWMNSPQLQVLVAEHWSASAALAQRAAPPNPRLVIERVRSGEEIELSKVLHIGLLELLFLPQRQAVAQHRQLEQQTRLVMDLVHQATSVRQAWVKAVAAQQQLVYAVQINDAAKASSELARRLKAVGNFSELQRARQQAFYADATAQWALAQHAHQAGREELVRLLGLNDADAAQMQLPDRLPELPTQAISPVQVQAKVQAERLDVQQARHTLNAELKAQGLDTIENWVGLEANLGETTVNDHGQLTRSTSRGLELSVQIPLLDFGRYGRQALSARTQAAAHRLDAATRAANSHVRQAYSAYRTALDLAKHYRDEVVPLRKAISDENLLRYNGMFISVFELLADAREQMGSVQAAIAAQQQFWLAETALQASILGVPQTIPLGAAPLGAAAPEGH
jgi:outer membrane protein TolC